MSFSDISELIITPLKELKDSTGIVISSIAIKVIVDSNNKVVDGEILGLKIPTHYEEIIIENIKNSGKFISGEIENEKVCSFLIFPVSCIKWLD